MQGISKYLRTLQTAPAGRLRTLFLGKYDCEETPDDNLVMQSLCYRIGLAPYFITPSARRYGLFFDEELQEEQKEVEAVRTFLLAYPELQSFFRSSFFGFFRSWQFRPLIKYQMEINRAGRVLVETDTGSDSKSLPLSIWPLVLARAWNVRSYKIPNYTSPDGIYYLLRNFNIIHEIFNQRLIYNY